MIYDGLCKCLLRHVEAISLDHFHSSPFSACNMDVLQQLRSHKAVQWPGDLSSWETVSCRWSIQPGVEVFHSHFVLQFIEWLHLVVVNVQLFCLHVVHWMYFMISAHYGKHIFFSILLYPRPYSTSNDFHRSMHFIACPNFNLKSSCHWLSLFSNFSIFMYPPHLCCPSPHPLPRPPVQGLPRPQQRNVAGGEGHRRDGHRQGHGQGHLSCRRPRKMVRSPWLYRGCTVGVAWKLRI